MRIFLIIFFMLSINILPLFADDPVQINQPQDLPAPEAFQEAGNDSAKYENKHRFQAPGNPYMIERKLVTDPVNHYREELDTSYHSYNEYKEE